MLYQLDLGLDDQTIGLEPSEALNPAISPARKRRRRGRGTGSYLNRGLGMYVPTLQRVCPVPVRSYMRWRLGRWEHVRAHCRRFPQR